jgi:hypothetical protein
MTNFDVETEKEINNFRLCERYINALKWSKNTDDYIKTVVIGNIRNVYSWLYTNGFINKDKIQEYFWQDQIRIDKERKDLHERLSH